MLIKAIQKQKEKKEIEEVDNYMEQSSAEEGSQQDSNKKMTINYFGNIKDQMIG